MKYIKFTLLNIVVFGGLLLLLSLALPSSVAFSTDKVFDINAAAMMPKIKQFDKWSLLAGKDDVIKTEGDSIVTIQHKNEKLGNLTSRFYLSADSTTHINWAVLKPLPWYKPWEKFTAMLQDKGWRSAMDSSFVALEKFTMEN